MNQMCAIFFSSARSVHLPTTTITTDNNDKNNNDWWHRMYLAKSNKFRSFVKFGSCSKFVGSWFVRLPLFSHLHTAHKRMKRTLHECYRLQQQQQQQRRYFIHSQLNIYAVYMPRWVFLRLDRISEKAVSSSEQTVLYVSVKWIVVFQFFS